MMPGFQKGGDDRYKLIQKEQTEEDIIFLKKYLKKHKVLYKMKDEDM